MKQWLTTGEIAKALNVATRTVTGWIDSGRMKGIRIPSISLNPRSKGDRRVYRDEFESFCHQYGFRLNGEFREQPIVLTLGCEIAEPEGLEIVETSSVFEAGILTERFKPDAVVIDYAIGRIESRDISDSVRRINEYKPCLIAIVRSNESANEVLDFGFGQPLFMPFNGQYIIKLIRSQS